MDSRTVIVTFAGLALVGLAGCGQSSNSGAIHLIDGFKIDMVKQSPAKRNSPEPAGLWNFAEPAPGSSGASEDKDKATLGWKAGIGVSGLTLKDGRLKGHTTAEFPIIYVERNGKLDTTDVLYSIELRLRASKGANLMVNTQGPGELNFKEILERAAEVKQPWAFTSAIVAGENLQTIVLRNARTTRLSTIRKLLIRPTDVDGADFEIESVRLTSQKEHLAKIPSGIGWQGMGEIYRESLVSRSPEAIERQVKLPAKPWLELHLGILDESPITFRVAADGATLLERTVTTPDRWEEASVDLSSYGGRSVNLSLSLKGEKDGAVGIWGASVIRNRDGDHPSGRQQPRVDLTGGRVPQGVILMVSDTTRRDHLNSYGYQRETAPTLARIAGQGVRFTDNISQATWTKVSFPTIMTSLYSSTNTVKETNDQLPAAAVTLAEVFRDAGYATVGFSSVAFNGKLTALHQGYEEFHEATSIPEPGSKTARTYVDRLGQWLARHRQEPFFVLLHVFDPHPPLEPRRPYNTLWSNPDKRAELDKNIETLKKFIKHADDRGRLMATLEEMKESGVNYEEMMSNLVGWYDGSIKGEDTEIARLLERLKELGLADKTLLAYTADHGEEFHEHGRMWHGQTVYGELTCVPLMFYGPGFIPGGLVIDQTTQNIDIMPTLIELSHLPLPKNIQGQSLLPLMAAAKEVGSGDPSKLRPVAEKYGWTHRPAFSEKALTQQSGGPRPYDTESYAVVYDGWKLIRNSKRADGTPEFELFDHKNDPLNRKNVADQHPDIVKRLTETAEKLRQSAIAAALPKTGVNSKMSAEELQRLRSLGYVQ
jgi:arylsulfatase A-like enzyme